MKKQKGIFGSIRMNKQKYIDEFLRLYRQGLNDSQIAKELGISYIQFLVVGDLKWDYLKYLNMK